MTAAPALERPSTWAPFRQPVYRSLWIAQFAANVGTWMQNVGAVWLMGTLGGSLLQIALVQTAASLPIFLFGIPAGALADIVDRRRMLLLSQTWLALCALAVGVLAYAGLMTPNLLLLLTFLIGLGGAVNLPAWQSLVPELVPRRDLPQAVALSAANTNLGRVFGPAAGGIIIALADTHLTFFINAIAAVGVLVVVARWRRPAKVSELPAERLVAAVRAGARYALNSPSLQAVLARAVLFTMPANVVLTLLPVVARQDLGLSADGFGLLLGAFGAGAVVAAVALPRWRDRLSSDGLLTAAALGFAASCVLIGVLRDVAPVVLATAVAGFCWLTVLATTNFLAQRAVPDWMRARGVATYFVLSQGGLALGGAVWGLVGEWFSVQVAFVASAAAVVVCAAIGMLRWRLSQVELLDLRPSGHWPEPVVVVEPGPHDGPVLVTSEYRVALAQTREFAAAMRRVGRARQRVGASAWGLYGDPAQPGRFVETFIVESWSEYLRQRDRVTHTDRAIEESALAFLEPGSDVVTTHHISAYAEGDGGA